MPKDESKYGSMDYKKWPAYLDLDMNETANSTIDWTLSDSVILELQNKKCCVEEP